MKRNLLMAGLVLLALASCKKEESEGGNGDNSGQSSNTVSADLELVDSQAWAQDAAVGVYTADDINVKFSLVEGAGTTTGKFQGQITKGTTLLAAYIPYVEDAEDMQAVPVHIPASVPQENLSLARFQVAEVGESLAFSDKLTTLKVSFANVEGTTYEGKSISSITVNAARNIVGTFTANTTSLITSLADTYQSTSSVELSYPSGTIFNKDLVGYASVASYLKGGDKLSVSLIVDGKSITTELQISESSAEGQEFELVVDAGLFEPKLELEWVCTGLGEVRSNSPAVDPNGNVYMTTAKESKLHKINADGTYAWGYDMGFTPDNHTSPSMESDGSVIYAGGGSSNTGCYCAINPDGTLKWAFTTDKFFGNGGTPGPNFNQITAVVGKDNIYIGNAGITGSVLSINKTTGERVAYVSGSSDGTGGPAGGVQSGLGMSKDGYIAWHVSGGTFVVDQKEMDNPSRTHADYGAYAPYCYRYGYNWNGGYPWQGGVKNGVAFLSIGGVNYVAAGGMEKTSGGSYKMRVFCAPVGATESAWPALSTTWKGVCQLANIQNQDQGGIVIGPRNEIIVSLKNLSGGTPGGIVAVSSDDFTVLYKYEVNADVAGTPAVDAAGNIHFVTDDPGKYYIVKPDYTNKTATLVAEANLYELTKAAGIDVGEATAARIWSSIAIGADGKMYVGATYRKNWSETASFNGAVACFSYAGCTGPGSTSWPMKGADAQHTGNQK